MRIFSWSKEGSNTVSCTSCHASNAIYNSYDLYWKYFTHTYRYIYIYIYTFANVSVQEISIDGFLLHLVAYCHCPQPAQCWQGCEKVLLAPWPSSVLTKWTKVSKEQASQVNLSREENVGISRVQDKLEGNTYCNDSRTQAMITSTKETALRPLGRACKEACRGVHWGSHSPWPRKFQSQEKFFGRIQRNEEGYKQGRPFSTHRSCLVTHFGKILLNNSCTRAHDDEDILRILAWHELVWEGFKHVKQRTKSDPTNVEETTPLTAPELVGA